MTPAIQAARRAGIAFEILEYAHDPRAASFGQEAAVRLGLPTEQVFKTLLVALQGARDRLAVGIVSVADQLDLKAMAKACAAKKADLAEPAQAERATGYLVGGISPLGQKRSLPTALDVSAAALPTVYVSAGRRGLEIALAPSDLLVLTGGRYAAIAKR